MEFLSPSLPIISIDESTGMMQISGQQQYKCGRYLNFSESRKLPDYIIKNKLYHKVRCTFVDGRIRIDLPDNNSTCTVSRSPYKLRWFTVGPANWPLGAGLWPRQSKKSQTATAPDPPPELSPSLTGSKTSGSHPGSDSGIMSASSSLKK